MNDHVWIFFNCNTYVHARSSITDTRGKKKWKRGNVLETSLLYYINQASNNKSLDPRGGFWNGSFPILGQSFSPPRKIIFDDFLEHPHSVAKHFPASFANLTIDNKFFIIAPFSFLFLFLFFFFKGGKVDRVKSRKERCSRYSFEKEKD